MTLVPVDDRPNYGGTKWYHCTTCGRYVDESKAADGCPYCSQPTNPIPLPAGAIWDDLAEPEPEVLVRVRRVLAEDPRWMEDLTEVEELIVEGSIAVTYSQFVAWCLAHRQGQGDRNPTDKVVAGQLSVILGTEFGIAASITAEQAKRKVRTFDERLRSVLPAEWRDHAEFNAQHARCRADMIRRGVARPGSKVPDILIVTTSSPPDALRAVPGTPAAAKHKRRRAMADPETDEDREPGREAPSSPSPRAVESDAAVRTDRRTRRKVHVVIRGLEEIYDKADSAGHEITEPEEYPPEPEESSRQDPDE